MADVSHTITARGDLARRLREHAGKKLAREVLPDVARDAAERGNAIFARDYRTVTGAGHGQPGGAGLLGTRDGGDASKRATRG